MNALNYWIVFNSFRTKKDQINDTTGAWNQLLRRMLENGTKCARRNERGRDGECVMEMKSKKLSKQPKQPKKKSTIAQNPD